MKVAGRSACHGFPCERLAWRPVARLHPGVPCLAGLKKPMGAKGSPTPPMGTDQATGEL